MKGIFITYNLENENWTDEEYEEQEDREIFIPISDLKELIENRDKACFDKWITVDLIGKIREVWE